MNKIKSEKNHVFYLRFKDKLANNNAMVTYNNSFS